MKMGNHVRIIKGKKAREYEKLACQEMLVLGLDNKMIKEDLEVWLELHPPTRRKTDIDNRTKGIFDSLSAARFWEDDCQVKKLHIEMKDVIKGGKVVVKVAKLDGAPRVQSASEGKS